MIGILPCFTLTSLEFQVELVDRSLLPGDVVRSLSNPQGQKGHIKDVNVYVDFRIAGTSHIIKNMRANKLTPLTVCANKTMNISHLFGQW